ncbi:MAG: hypothetical protein ACFFC1_17545 [Promethearchaeota archaeon]
MENNIDKLKILVIGSKGHRYVDCVEWNNVSYPNIVDYDIVIVNVRSISDDFLKKVSSETINTLQLSLARLVMSKGTLIVLSDFISQVERKSKYPSRCNNYFWTPLVFGFIFESGTTIKMVNDIFTKYHSSFRKWSYYFPQDNFYITREMENAFDHISNALYKLEFKVFYQNRYGQMLSGCLWIEVYHGKRRVSSQDALKKLKVSGKIILLPLLENLEDRDAVNLVLEDLIGKKQTSLPPSWSDKIKMPFVDEIDKKIENCQKEIDNQFVEISKLEKSKLEFEEYKKLLYTDGPELEEIFKKCLNELGAKVEPARYSEEEYCLVYNEEDYPVEAKGVSKSIALVHLRQIRDYMDIYEDKTGKESHGILLGNAWKNIPIEERNSKEKPIFPNNVIKRATNLNISLVSSVDFFYAFCGFLEDKSLGQKIIDKIVNSVGVVSFKDL